jgi:uncharacterized protein YgiM (DUF1202 family)
MKQFFLFSLFLILTHLSAEAQSAKVVIDPNGIICRYLEENDSCYHIEIQDDAWIPKKLCKVETYSAAKGQGVIIAGQPGTINVRQKPTKASRIIFKIVTPEGELPECFRCLGKVNGWYKIMCSNGQPGFIYAKLVYWDCICTL